MQVHFSKLTEDVIYEMKPLLNRIRISCYYQEVATIAAGKLTIWYLPAGQLAS